MGVINHSKDHIQASTTTINHLRGKILNIILRSQATKTQKSKVLCDYKLHKISTSGLLYFLNIVVTGGLLILVYVIKKVSQ